MAFNVPTLGEVVRTVENGFGTAFYGSAGVLRVTVLKLLAKVIAGAVYMPILACRYIWQNSFATTADAEGLNKIGSDYTLPHKPVTYSHGSVVISGADGTVVPAGTIFVYENSGKEYELLADVKLNLTQSLLVKYGVGQVRAVEPGADSDLGSGLLLAFRDGTPEGIESVTVSGVYGGRSEPVQVGSAIEQWGETLEEYRARVQFRRRNQPQGGSAADYVGWCTRFGFVTGVFPFPNWPNTNNITLFVFNAGAENYSVTPADAATVQSYVNDVSRKPLCSNPLVVPATPVKVSVDINFAHVSSAVESAVTAAIKNYLRGFGPGLTIQKTDLYSIAASASGDPLCSVGTLRVNGAVGQYISLRKLAGANPVGDVVDVNSLVVNCIQV